LCFKAQPGEIIIIKTKRETIVGRKLLKNEENCHGKKKQAEGIIENRQRKVKDII